MMVNKADRNLLSMKQGNDSVKVFARRIRTAVARGTLGEGVAKQVFIIGLKAKISKQILMKKEPMTLEEAVKKAIKLEDVLQVNEEKIREEIGRDEDIIAKVEQVEKKIDQALSAATSMNAARSPQPPFQYWQKRGGFRGRGRSNFGQRGRFRGGSSQWSAPVRAFCYYCGETGHYMKTCPMKISAERGQWMPAAITRPCDQRPSTMPMMPPLPVLSMPQSSSIVTPKDSMTARIEEGKERSQDGRSER